MNCSPSTIDKVTTGPGLVNPCTWTTGSARRPVSFEPAEPVALRFECTRVHGDTCAIRIDKSPAMAKVLEPTGFAGVSFRKGVDFQKEKGEWGFMGIRLIAPGQKPSG